MHVDVLRAVLQGYKKLVIIVETEDEFLKQLR